MAGALRAPTFKQKGVRQAMYRRTILRIIGSAVATALIGATTGAAAQTDKPAVLVVPYAPGGTSDMLGRLIAQQLGSATGRSVVVENRAGAGTAVGASQVARATADGATMLLATSTTLAINPSLYAKLTYDPVKDFAPVSLVAAVPLMVVVHPSLDARSLADLVALAKRSPDALLYGSAGNGSPQHLGAEMFKSVAGIEMKHVPYKGSAPAITDLVGGQINVMFTDIAPAMPYVRSGRLRVLAVTTAGRQPTIPEVPTIAESGVAGTTGFEAVAWQGIVVPAGTPKDAIAELNRHIVKTLALPEVQRRLHEMGVEPRSSSPEQFASYITSEAERWGKVIGRSGAKVD